LCHDANDNENEIEKAEKNMTQKVKSEPEAMFDAHWFDIEEEIVISSSDET